MDIGDTSIGASIGAVLTATLGLIGGWLKYRATSDDTKTRALAKNKDSETEMVPELLAHIAASAQQIDDLRRELRAEMRASDEACERRLSADRAKCDAQIARLRRRHDGEIGRLRSQLAAVLDLIGRAPGVTDSMSEEVERIRASTPPRGIHRGDIDLDDDDGA